MEKIIKYQCEICKTRFTKKQEALDCEKVGVLKLLPIGLVFNYQEDKKIIFAVIKQYPNEYRHHHSYSVWATRDTGMGDNIGGEDYCGHESWSNKYLPNKKLPAYKRMLDALKKADIKPIIYKGD